MTIVFIGILQLWPIRGGYGGGPIKNHTSKVVMATPNDIGGGRTSPKRPQ
jgi:hypothetical protein